MLTLLTLFCVLLGMQCFPLTNTAFTIGDCTCPLCYGMEVDVDTVDTVLCPAWHAMFPAMEVDVDTVLCPAWHAMFPVNQHCSHYWRLYMSTVLWK